MRLDTKTLTLEQIYCNPIQYSAINATFTVVWDALMCIDCEIVVLH